HLVRNNVYMPARLRKLVYIVVAYAGKPHLTLAYEIFNGSHSFGNGCSWVGPMDLVQVDIIRLQAAETRLALFDHAVIGCILVDVDLFTRVVLAFEIELPL